MTTTRERVLTGAGVAIGAMWLAAAAAKVVKPYAAYELATRAAPVGVPTKLLLTAAIAGEAWLGAAMCVRAVRGFSWSLAALVVATAVLLLARSHVGPDALCGCFGALLGTTVDEALVRNGVLGALHVGLIAVGVSSRRRPSA